jgi:hypothetical protein
MTAKCSEEDFIQTWIKCNGNAAKIAKAIGVAEREVYRRRVSIEGRRGILLPSSEASVTGRPKKFVNKIGHRITLKIRDGSVPVFGDAHYWPNDAGPAHHALVRWIKLHKPVAVICNGDMFDGARISRHPPAGFTNMPEVADELSYCQDMMAEIANAAPENAPLCWNAGNHDSRFSARIAQMAPEFVRVEGMDLPDHFKSWNFAWSTFINDDVVTKHRWKGGIHATYSNVRESGRNICTSHLHRLCITPVTDYNGRRWGCDVGMLSSSGPQHDKYTYGEDNPSNWGEGFCVLTFSGGKLLPPELVQVQDGIAWWRGERL